MTCPFVRSLLASHASNADLMAILSEQGFNPKKVSEALAIEIPRNKHGDDIRAFNKALHARSNGLLPVQDWDKVEIATLRSSTTSAVLRCCKIGGGAEPPMITFAPLRGRPSQRSCQYTRSTELI